MSNTAKRDIKTKRQFRIESTGIYMSGRPVFKVFELDKAGRNWLHYGLMPFDKGASHEEKVRAVLWDEIRQEM